MLIDSLIRGCTATHRESKGVQMVKVRAKLLGGAYKSNTEVKFRQQCCQLGDFVAKSADFPDPLGD